MTDLVLPRPPSTGDRVIEVVDEKRTNIAIENVKVIRTESINLRRTDIVHIAHIERIDRVAEIESVTVTVSETDIVNIDVVTHDEKKLSLVKKKILDLSHRCKKSTHHHENNHSYRRPQTVSRSEAPHLVTKQKKSNKQLPHP